VALLQQDPKKNEVLFVPDGQHSPSTAELKEAYQKIFDFLDKH
jgi:fermentation-respiration switch protein FrsA (DUF1100 family)